MKLSISRKIVSLTTAAVIVSSIVVLCISYFLFSKQLNKFEDDHVAAMQLIAERMQDMDKQKILQSAKMLSTMPELVAALSAGEADELKRIARMIRGQWGFDAVTITDAKGIVVARGHSDKTGDDISKRPTIVAATQGRFESGLLFDPSAVVPFTIRCDAPVYQGNNLAGILSLATSVGTEAQIDNLRSLMGMHVTLFSGDTRLMTSIKDTDGKRILGTKMQDAEILDRVLKRGETVIKRLTILDELYDAAYWPVKDLNGSIVGMWFIGDPLAETIADQRRTIMIVVVSSALVALLVALLASVMSGKIARPVRLVADYASQVADGNLDAPLAVQSHDEVGLLIGALQRMVRTLKERISEAETVSAQAREQAEQAHEAKMAAEAAGEAAQKSHEEILVAAERLESAVKVIRQASTDLTERIREAEDDASKQAEYITASASAMTQMSVSAQEITTTASNAKELSVQTREKASKGEKIVENVIGSISGLQKNSLELKDDMTELSVHAKSISQIMNVISDIADQTNLLALNAAIEAARAGEAGRGFAVVADEVRKLAEKTMVSTGDVSRAVSAIHKSMDVSMTQVGTTVDSIGQVTQLAAESGEALREIVAMADDTARQVEGIALACEHQAAANEHVSHSIEEVSTIAGKTHATMEGASRDIAELATQTDTLGGLVAEMKRSS
ncbi:MAG: methyl-accepting chemotaxis protein [Desulfovibrionaceae bacterium]|nr:methyl-accepting chemotaxis protein [Desulfovibrionaceae bacterium]